MEFSTNPEDYSSDGLPAPGEHFSFITGIAKNVSNKGNEQIEIRFSLMPGMQPVREWISFVDNSFFSKNMKKLAFLCRAIDPNMQGLRQDPTGFDPYNQASLDKHLLGKIVRINIIKVTSGRFTNLRIVEDVEKAFGGITEKQRAQLKHKFDEGDGSNTPPMPEDALIWQREQDNREGYYPPSNNTNNNVEDDDIPF